MLIFQRIHLADVSRRGSENGVLDNYALSNMDTQRAILRTIMQKLKTVLKVLKNFFIKVIKFPVLVGKKFWQLLKYVWKDRKNMLLPFLLGEFTYWLPMALVVIASIITKNPVWAISFWGVYVGVLPAIPIQIALMFFYYALIRRIKYVNNKTEPKDSMEESKRLIDRINKIS